MKRILIFLGVISFLLHFFTGSVLWSLSLSTVIIIGIASYFDYLPSQIESPLRKMDRKLSSWFFPKNKKRKNDDGSWMDEIGITGGEWGDLD